jgi:hypothetical protein
MTTKKQWELMVEHTKLFLILIAVLGAFSVLALIVYAGWTYAN